ncbi:hypothetical protein [Acetanaerobacterium elongatum]|uniref:Uncharacterized membrane protein n=1 Tax=Acetanaerobacterium elongatum TaxID=258515 RepID=A0A1G9TXN9_9FIRM|nr:hypothetical protein [Acetanaerobacterium elongatum]SDM52351.1 Uncharacterized membrane protein [Acetanaerobacterium elongatum]
MTEEQKTTEATIPEFDPADIEKNKAIAGIAYLGILFFLPLVICPDSKYGKFHANQGLVLLIFGIVASIVGTILAFIPYIGWLFQLLLSLGVLALAIMGLINGFTGKAKELPIIGKIRILK